MVTGERSGEAAREALRREHGVRLVSSAEEGSAAARLPAGTLVIVPFGNDGVGVPGPFVAAAPAQMHILVARAAGAAVLAAARPYPRIAVARIEADGASRALVPRLAALFKAAPCWHSAPAGPLLAVFANTCRERI